MSIIAFETAPQRIYHSARVRRLTSLLQQIGRRGVQHSTNHCRAVSPVASMSMPSTASQFESSPQVARVDDPFGEISVFAVRGVIEPGTIAQLRDLLADLDRGRFVHLDLGDSSIRTIGAMRSLELIADDLEGRGIVLRVVGLDPQHPMLSPTL